MIFSLYLLSPSNVHIDLACILSLISLPLTAVCILLYLAMQTILLYAVQISKSYINSDYPNLCNIIIELSPLSNTSCMLTN